MFIDVLVPQCVCLASTSQGEINIWQAGRGSSACLMVYTPVMLDKIFCKSLSCTVGVGVGAVDVVSAALSDAPVGPLEV